ncbi:MAG: DoxX family protein [Propionibacteriales bacterium]|nr:DoxX family protein [Propionibacteriales bacterium]
MKLAVWIVSALLALAFIFIGGSKLVVSAADLESMAEGVPVVLLRIAGTAEVLGALGLVLPAASRILPILTPVAATGLVLTMIGASITNVIIDEYALVAQTVILGALAGFVAWARFGRYAIQPRGTAEPAVT